jgi:hypothetical protein
VELHASDAPVSNSGENLWSEGCVSTGNQPSLSYHGTEQCNRRSGIALLVHTPAFTLRLPLVITTFTLEFETPRENRDSLCRRACFPSEKGTAFSLSDKTN